MIEHGRLVEQSSQAPGFRSGSALNVLGDRLTRLQYAQQRQNVVHQLSVSALVLAPKSVADPLPRENVSTGLSFGVRVCRRGSDETVEHQGKKLHCQDIRAGYVYVISNLGSFRPGIVKIGMTRRLEPMDRVRELGDASVPFGFDVHALFFSDDAVGVEAELHRRFAHARVNRVNLAASISTQPPLR